MVAPACADWTLTFPADDGNCGQQLTTDGCGVTSWAAACSVRDHKQCINPACKEHAYNAVKSATVYDFAYKPGYGIKSSRGFTGIMADEAPWAMQGGNGDIFSPINAFGHLMAAVQVIDEKLDNVSARVEALEAA